MPNLHHSHMFRILQDDKGFWKPMRIAYVAKGNGSIDTSIVRPTSITNHGQNIQVMLCDEECKPISAVRTYKSSLCIKVTTPEDKFFKNATDIVIN